MALTSIADRLTPSAPIQITFGDQPIAVGAKFATLIGHMAASGGTGSPYDVHQVSSVGDPDAAKAEVDAIAGAGSQIGKMAAAFVKVNSAVSGRANFPAFRVVLLNNTDTAFGAADEALTAIKMLRSDLIVSPYEASASPSTLRTKLTDLAALISGPDRDLNGQFGTTCVIASLAAQATAVAINADNLNLIIPWMQDTSVSPSQSVGEVAAAMAGLMLQLAFPYNGLNGEQMGGLVPPVLKSDYIINGPTERSEVGLAAGLAPIYIDAAGRVRLVRSRLSRVTIDGIVVATDYIDWQQVVVLYDFKEGCFEITQQPTFKNQKASIEVAKRLKDEVLRLAKSFEVSQALQNVNESAKQFVVASSTTSRGRFDFKIPVDAIPILNVVAGNIVATNFGTFTL